MATRKTRRSRKVQFRVTLTLPDDATIADAKDYVRDAVASMKGCLNPGMRGDGTRDPDEADPMFYLEGDTVRVTSIRPRR